MLPPDSPSSESSDAFERLAKTYPEGRDLRLGIMGGTFDPIHFGHLDCAQQAADQLALHAVVFVPAGNPHFKQGITVAPCEDRLAMCELACAPNPTFAVSDVEIARSGITYTLDTIEGIRTLLPHARLFFVIGSDAFLTLPGWKGFERLVGEVTFAVILRGDDVRRDVDGLSARHGIAVAPVAAPRLDVSSSELRDLSAQGRSIRYLTPDVVCSYIRRQGLYGSNATGEAEAPKDDWGRAFSARFPEALTPGFFADRREELASRVSPKRLRHIEGVVETARMLARAYGVNEEKAALAGLLHDWDKGYDDEGIRKRVVEVGIADEIDPFVMRHMPQVLHGPTAASALAQRFPQIPSDVIRAIRNHTTASPDADDLEKIVYIADAIEPSRTFDEAEALREGLGEVGLDELFFRVYEFWTLALLRRGKVLHPDTIRIWNSLAQRRHGGAAEGAHGKPKGGHHGDRKKRSKNDRRGHDNGKRG